MKRATFDDLKSNSNKYAAFWCQHTSERRTKEEIARIIEQYPARWLGEINNLVARIQKEKRVARTWKPTPRCAEVLEMIQSGDVHITVFWKKYKQSINALCRHGWIDYRVNTKGFAEFDLIHRA